MMNDQLEFDFSCVYDLKRVNIKKKGGVMAKKKASKKKVSKKKVSKKKSSKSKK